MSKVNLSEQVRHEIRDELTVLGLQPGKNGSHIRLQPGIVGWVGLNSGYYHDTDQVSILPHVGISHEGVERLVAELAGWKYDPRDVTVTSPLPSLMPRQMNHRWVFGRGEDHGPLISEIRQAVEAYGLPFMRAGASLEALRELVEAGTGYEHLLLYRLPTIPLLQGDKAGAALAIQQELSALGRREDPAARNFRLFASRFRERYLSDLAMDQSR